LFAGGWAIQQLWVFWLAPIIGGALGGLVYTWLGKPKPDIVGDAQ
jgi:aquaporin Z